MGLKLVAEIYKYFNKYVPPYMAYSQNMAKFSCGWFWRIQNWKRKKILKNHWTHYYKNNLYGIHLFENEILTFMSKYLNINM